MEKKPLTCSNTLQLRLQPDELQVKLKILIASCCKFRAEFPNRLHHSAVISEDFVFLDLIAMGMPKRPSPFLYIDSSVIILSCTSILGTNLWMLSYNPLETSSSNSIAGLL